MDHHPSTKKCNQPECQKSKGWYVHKTFMPTSNDVINQQNIQSFTCKTCQNNFIDKNILMHNRKRESPINIVCKYFLKKTRIRSNNQRALCWFRYDELSLSAPNVANNAPGVATSVSPLWNTNFPLLLGASQSLMSGLQQKNSDDYATAETPMAAATAPRADENGDDPNDEHEYVNTVTDDNIE